MTVLEVIRRSAEFLDKKAVDSPRLQAELLLAHVLKLPRMQLYLQFERELTLPELDGVRDLVKRRGLREPLQQILGSTSFCGLEIGLNRDVLVPRPETELLAENAWVFANRLAGADARPVTALDFGTGSGCLAVALAVHCPSVRVHAVDISAEALAVARHNVERHGVGERVVFSQSDGFAALATELRFDLIVANPPYIPSAEIATLAPEVRDYEPHLALDGGPDGLSFYRRFALEAVSRVQPGAKVLLEFGDGQAAALREIFEQQNWIVEPMIEDYTQRPRIIIASHG